MVHARNVSPTSFRIAGYNGQARAAKRARVTCTAPPWRGQTRGEVKAIRDAELLLQHAQVQDLVDPVGARSRGRHEVPASGLELCVWELPPIGRERDAWVRHMLLPEKPDLDAYLADSMPDGLTGRVAGPVG